jgi:deacetylase
MSTSIFLSPHADDICFSSFWAIAGIAPKTAQIVTVFSESCWTFRSAPNLDIRAEVTAIRHKEDIAFAKYVHAEYTTLGLPDSSLRYPLGSGGEYIIEADDMLPEVRQRITESVQHCEGALSVFAPIGVSQHVDHLLVRDAALDLFQGRAELVLYEDLPYAARLTPDAIAEFVRGTKLTLSELRFVESGTRLSKRAALALYPSQLEATTACEILCHAESLVHNGASSERAWRVEFEG